MNYKELKELAKKGALVRWSPSGAVEMLRWSKNGSVQAINLISRMEHMLTRRKEYFCVEVQLYESVPLNSLMMVRTRTPRKFHPSPIFKKEKTHG